jgi:hypothetical protein
MLKMLALNALLLAGVAKEYGMPINYAAAYDEVLNRPCNELTIEVFDTVSDGSGGGYTSEGYYLTYNTIVENGETVQSIIIYNPATQYGDDVIAVIDNGIIR